MVDPVELHDNGMALGHVIGHILEGSGDRKVEVGTGLVEAALEMKDRSQRKIITPVSRGERPGVLHVGDMLIAVGKSAFDGVEEGGRDRILLTIDEGQPVADLVPTTRATLERLPDFVARIVLLRAVGSNPVIREWLVGLALRFRPPC